MIVAFLNDTLCKMLALPSFLELWDLYMIALLNLWILALVPIFELQKRYCSISINGLYNDIGTSLICRISRNDCGFIGMNGIYRMDNGAGLIDWLNE